jgi:hypothetical protein
MKPRAIPRSIPKTFVTPISRGPLVTILKAADVAAVAGFDPGDVYAFSDWARDHSAVVSSSQDLEAAAREAIAADSLCAVIVCCN